MVQDTRDWDYLKGQTYTILGLSVMTAGLMTLLPESITKWDAEDRKLSGLGKSGKIMLPQAQLGIVTNIF